MAIELTQDFLALCFQKVSLTPLSLGGLTLDADVSEVVSQEMEAWGLALASLGAWNVAEDKLKDFACHVRSFFIDEAGQFRPHRSLLLSESQWGALMAPKAPSHAPQVIAPISPPSPENVHLAHWKKARF